MTRVADTGQFDIRVRCSAGLSHTYRTVKPLSLASADALHGRATRVWECQQLNGAGVPIPDSRVALKDYWIDRDRQREGKIYARIRKAVKCPESKIILDESLLQVKEYGDVYVGGRMDTTRKPNKHAVACSLVLQPTEEAMLIKQEEIYVERTTVSTPRTGPVCRMIQVAGAKPRYHQKVHHRVVFLDVGIPLHEVTSLSVVFKSLHGIIGGEYCSSIIS